MIKYHKFLLGDVMKKICCFLLALSLLIPFGIINSSDTMPVMGETNELAPTANSVVVMEASTGTIIYERNSNEKKSPASMTKMMTMLLIVEAIEKGIVKWDDIVIVSSRASGMGGSQILLETNERMSVDDLFKGIAIASGNDASVAMAEKIAGTEEMFVTMMNNRARELGLKDTNFKNSHGLDEANHYSTAHDMTIIARELVKHPKAIEYTSIYEDYLRQGTDRSFWLVNTNKLVRFYDGVDGIKTGYTALAGFCVTATANINGMRVIVTVMGEPDSRTRNASVSSIFDYVYAQYALHNVIPKDNSLGEYRVDKGKREMVNIVPKEAASVLYRKIDDIPNTSYEINITSLKAPIKVGDVVGTLTLKSDDKVIKTIDLTVSEDVEKANIFELYWRYLRNTLSFNISF